MMLGEDSDDGLQNSVSEEESESNQLGGKLGGNLQCNCGYEKVKRERTLFYTNEDGDSLKIN
jgi:hypothetical protein